MRKTLRTAFVTAAVVGLGLAGAATANAGGYDPYDNNSGSQASQFKFGTGMSPWGMGTFGGGGSAGSWNSDAGVR